MKGANQSVLDARSLDWRAADMLRAQILSGVFPPGHRLTETRLASELDVSRGTIRTALRSLTYEGLVAQVAYSKWLVPELTLQDAGELTRLYEALSGLAARFAAEAGVSDLTAQDNESDMPIRLAAAARMTRLAKQLHVIAQQIERYQTALSLPQQATDWRPCLAAIEARDAAHAETLAGQLIANRQQPLIEEIQSGKTALNHKEGGNHRD